MFAYFDTLCETLISQVINGNGITVQPEKVVEIVEKLNTEPNRKKRLKMANGFKAYYRNPLFLPNCQATIDYLGEYGSKKEINAFNDMND